MAETTDTTITTQKKVRNSNIELFRIFLMLMIVAHHYVVNSGITLLYDYNHISFNQVFLWLWGWGGKVGINCFLLITGFFMCQQQITLKKFLKLYLEVKFYKILIFAIFCLSGYEAFTSIGLFKAVFNIAYGMGNGFVATFVGLFLLIPFINKMLSATTRREHLALVAVLTGLYTVFGTFFGNNIHENLGWFVTVYIIGAFLRLYPHQCFADRRMMTTVSASCLLLSWASIVIIGYFFPRGSGAAPIYYFVNDSHRILAIVCAVSFFLLFNSLKVKQSSIINTIASCTLGVLLIHAHSATMRHWLWTDVLHVTDYFGSDYLWLHALCSLLLVYFVCVALDLCRQHMIERPLFDWLGRRFPVLQ